MLLLRPADSADMVVMITRTAVLRARVGVMPGMGIGRGAEDGVKVGKIIQVMIMHIEGHAKKDLEPVQCSTHSC